MVYIVRNFMIFSRKWLTFFCWFVYECTATVWFQQDFDWVFVLSFIHRLHSILIISSLYRPVCGWNWERLYAGHLSCKATPRRITDGYNLPDIKVHTKFPLDFFVFRSQSVWFYARTIYLSYCISVLFILWSALFLKVETFQTLCN